MPRLWFKGLKVSDTSKHLNHIFKMWSYFILMTGAERTEERSSNTTTATHHCSDTSQGEALVAVLAKSIHTYYRYPGNTCFVFCLFFLTVIVKPWDLRHAMKHLKVTDSCTKKSCSWEMQSNGWKILVIVRGASQIYMSVAYDSNMILIRNSDKE